VPLTSTRSNCCRAAPLWFSPHTLPYAHQFVTCWNLGICTVATGEVCFFHSLLPKIGQHISGVSIAIALRLRWVSGSPKPMGRKSAMIWSSPHFCACTFSGVLERSARSVRHTCPREVGLWQSVSLREHSRFDPGPPQSGQHDRPRPSGSASNPAKPPPRLRPPSSWQRKSRPCRNFFEVIGVFNGVKRLAC